MATSSTASSVKYPKTAALAKKVPALKKTGLSEVERQEADFFRSAVVDALNYMYDEPEVARSCRDYARQKWLAVKQAKEIGDTGPPVSTRLDSYDEDFKVAYITTRTAITSAGLGEAKLHDAQIVKQVFRWLLNASANVEVPPECGDRKVMETACDKRLAECGRAALVAEGGQKLVGDDGTINWVLGTFSLTDAPGDDGARELTHRPTKDKTIVGAEFHVGDGWSFRNNHDDMSTLLWRSAAHNFPVHKFFKDKEGPNKNKPLRGADKRWLAMVQLAHKDVQAGKTGVAVTPEAKASFSSPMAKAKQTSTEAARAALKRKAEQVNTRVRCVKIR